MNSKGKAFRLLFTLIFLTINVLSYEKILQSQELQNGCETLGCIDCLDDGTCESCGSGSVLKQGKCVCQNFLEKLNEEKQCSKCLIPGCGSCQKRTQKCRFCLDPRAIFSQHHQCSCPLNETFDIWGFCRENVKPGCIQYSVQNTTECLQCVENNQAISLIAGECACESRFDKPSQDGKCMPCLIPGCGSCANTLESSICLQCMDPRSIMNADADRCLCPVNERLNFKGLCSTCRVTGCEKCLDDDNEVCEICGSGSLVDGKCVCSEDTFFDIFGVCQKCLLQGCYKCESFNSCLECNDERAILLNGQCMCEPGYQMNSEGICSACNVQGCFSCVDKNENACHICKDSKAHIEDGQCVCPEKKYMNSEGFCVLEGTYIKNRGIIDECSVGCKECKGSTSCSACFEGYFLKGQNCVRCHPSCKFCTGSNKNECSECYRSEYLANGKCIPCEVDNCQTCKGDKCDTCLEGFVQSSGICEQCAENCKTCKKQKTCDECKDGYALDSRGNCLQCISSCTGCLANDITECTECPLGSFVENGQCSACPENCVSCQDEKSCLVCSSSWRLQLGKCEPICTKPCLHCEVQGGIEECTECLAGYHLKDGKCEEQPCLQCEVCPYGAVFAGSLCEECMTKKGCAACEVGNLKKCVKCLDGYYYDGQQCISCQQGCLQCSSAKFCQRCAQGFFSKHGQCIKCLHPCKACQNSENSCLSCNDKYEISGKQCVHSMNILYKLRLEASWNSFMSLIEKFKVELSKVAGQKCKPENITVKSIINGSVVLEGNLEVENKDQGEKIYDNLKHFLKEGQKIVNHKVISSQFSAKDFKIENQKTEPSLGLILGVCIGGFVTLLSIIIVLCAVGSENKDKQKPKNSEVIVNPENDVTLRKDKEEKEPQTDDRMQIK